GTGFVRPGEIQEPLLMALSLPEVPVLRPLQLGRMHAGSDPGPPAPALGDRAGGPNHHRWRRVRQRGPPAAWAGRAGGLGRLRISLADPHSPFAKHPGTLSANLAGGSRAARGAVDSGF